MATPVAAVAALSPPLSTAGKNKGLAVASATAGSAASTSNDQLSEVQWSAIVPLQQGENPLVVSVEDANGEIVEEAASTTVHYVEVPVAFDIDEDRLRIAGFSFTLDTDGYISRLVVHNYDTGEQTVYPQRLYAGGGDTCLKGDVEAFFYLDIATGSYQLRRFDLVGRNDSEVVTIPPGMLDPGPGYWAHVEGLECRAGHDYAYVRANFISEDPNGATRTRILRVHLPSEAIDVLSETDPDETPPWVAGVMALTADSLVTMGIFGEDRPLTRISLEDGSRSLLAPGLGVEGLAIAPALEDGVVYVATFDGIDRVDVAAGQKRNISEVQSHDPLVFAYPSSIAYDSGGHRVLVSDSGLDTLIAVDAATGERSDILSRSIGAGPRMVAPRAMTLSGDGSRAFVADDGSGTPEKLFEIDLASGDRRLIGDIDQQSDPFVTGIALDEENDLVYVAFPQTILQVDIDTGEIVVTAGEAIPGNRFSRIWDLSLDAANQRLLVADVDLGAIVAVDIASREQTVLSQGGVAGEGPVFEGLTSLALVPGSDHLYVTNSLARSVMRVELTTGNREVVLTDCLDDSGQNVLAEDESLHQILFNNQTNELLVLGNHLLSYDPETAACSVAFPWITTRGVLDVAVAPRDLLLGVVFGQLVQLDGESREVVILSK